MNGFPKTLRALEAQEDRSWPVADAIAEEIQITETGRVRAGEYDRCRYWLEERGYPVSTDYLADMRTTAVTFSTRHSRRHKVKFRLYVEAATTKATDPERDHWLATAEEQDMSLRVFSKFITGREWADTGAEKVRAAVKNDPKMVAEAVKQNHSLAKQIAVEAVKNPLVARAVIDDRDAQLALIRAEGQKAEENPIKPLPHVDGPEPFARLLTTLGIHQLRLDADNFIGKFRQFTGDYVFRVGEKEKLVAELDHVSAVINEARVLLTDGKVDDAALADLLKGK
jgi:hypothetical protein